MAADLAVGCSGFSGKTGFVKGAEEEVTERTSISEIREMDDAVLELLKLE